MGPLVLVLFQLSARRYRKVCPLFGELRGIETGTGGLRRTFWHLRHSSLDSYGSWRRCGKGL